MSMGSAPSCVLCVQLVAKETGNTAWCRLYGHLTHRVQQQQDAQGVQSAFLLQSDLWDISVADLRAMCKRRRIDIGTFTFAGKRDCIWALLDWTSELT